MPLTPQQFEKVNVMMENFIAENRPPLEIRNQLDIGWKLDKQSVLLFDIRPDWNDETIIRQHPFAKATWVQTRKEWQIFWLRSTLKWQSYAPLQTVVNLKRFLLEVEQDPYGCFKG